jgi:DNA-binding response OmpR family regulator
MRKIWIVTNRSAKFSPLVQALSSDNWGKTHWAENVEAAVSAASRSHPDLMIVDETIDGISGIEIARRLVLANAFVNLSVVSSLPEEEFHELSEGLGILVQLPQQPGQIDAETLKSALECIPSIEMPSPK